MCFFKTKQSGRDNPATLRRIVNGLESSWLQSLSALLSIFLLLHRHGLGQVTREIHVEAFHDSKPIGDQLQGNDVEDTLKDVDCLGNLNFLGLASLELLVSGVANDNRFAATSDNC